MATATFQDVDRLIDESAATAAEGDDRLAQLTTRVERIKSAKVDGVTDTRALTPVALLHQDGSHGVGLEFELGVGPTAALLGDVAHQQLAKILEIDWRYYQRMLEAAPELLATNLQHWMHKTPSERLVRMLKPDGLDEGVRERTRKLGAEFFVRGIMGKGYRTIDDADLVAAVTPTIIASGGKLVEFSIDERRMHAKFATIARTGDEIRQQYAEKYGITVAEIKAAHGHAIVDGKDIAWVNEPLAAGVTIRHSEVGFASLGASYFTRIMHCLNDYVGEQVVQIRHVGGKNNGELDGDLRLVSDATQLLDNAALLSRVNDQIKAELDIKRVFEHTVKFLAAKGEPIEVPAKVHRMEFIGNVGANLGLTLDETELLKEETTGATVREGGFTRFAAVQGITAVARQVTDYDRRVELERHAFRLLEDDAGALLRLGREIADKRRN